MNNSYFFESSGFFTSELAVKFCDVEIRRKCSFFERTDHGDYEIVFIQNGVFTFVCGGKTTVLKNGDVFISRPFENYYIIGEHNDKTFLQSLVIITFHPEFFKVENCEAFLKPFNERKKGENNCFRRGEFSMSVFDAIISPMSRYVSNNLGISNFAFAVGMLITEIGLIFSKRQNVAPSQDSHEYRVKVYDYILRNYCKNLTIDELSKKFSVSKWYINQTTQKFYNMSFHETIKSMRMWKAKNLMKHENNLNKVSNLCGYSDYSGFYRCYTKFFGVSPKEDIKHLKEKGHFLSHDNR